MIEKEFRRGERVASNVCGFYYGLPGRIIGPSQAQYDYYRRFIIELDIGKRISLPAHQIRKIDAEPEIGG